MARVCLSPHAHVGKMKNPKIVRLLLLYNILETVYRVVQATDGRTQAFIHFGELSHLVEDNMFHLQEYIKTEDASAISFTNLEEDNLNTYASPVSFQPVMLNFKTHAVGMPHMERVTVNNLSPDTSIHMLSISGNTLHFHCSFFQEKVIPPGGSTFFDVVFLARQEGPVENTLFIHTSLGSFKYQVTAIGIANPYRLRPFIGVRMPLNSSYSPVLHMHNPHSSTLQLTEMYTSGGDLHLELPSGDNEALRKTWEIPPYETKPIIKANFIARVEKNHTAFIRIKTNSSTRHNLILPVEVDVTSLPGIYSPIEVLDFGILRTHDPPKVLSLSLLNSGQKHVHIMNVIVTPVNEAVDVKFIPVKIPPDTVFSTQIATIAFNPSKAFHPKQCTGKIVVKSKNNQFKLHIPYQVQLAIGFLGFNKSCTRFYIGQETRKTKLDAKELNITNNFNVTIIIYSVSLAEEAKPHFKVNMNVPVVLTPGETSSAVWLTFQPAHRNLQLTTYLRLHTNISYFDIPLLCFSGRLKLFLPHAINESIIDFGTLGMGDKRTMIFAVINENPVDVDLKLWGSNVSKTYVELVGIDRGNASVLAWRQNFSSMAHSLILKPQHYAIFRIGITAPAYEGVLNGHAFVETQYEKINIPFSLRTARGGLKVDDIYFGNTFPGKIASLNLYVYSTFSHSMTVTGVTASPEDTRFNFDSLRQSPSVLHPNSRNLVGKVHFDLRKHCKNKCYSGLPTTTSMGHQWLLGMALPPDVADMDKDLFKTLHNRWKKLLLLDGKSINLTICLDTTEVRGHLLKAGTTLQWPRLFSRHSLKFPITEIGNRTVRDFILENPSSLPLIVQVVPLSLYPKPEEIINLMVEKFGGKLINLKRITADPEIFTLGDLEENNPSLENHIPAYRKSVEEYFGVQSHKQSIAILLTPGMRVRIHVSFTPKDELFSSSLILIRNNLTVLDVILVQGQGGYGELKFGNIPPGSDSSLNFELTDKHLKDCEGIKSSKILSPNFTVRKPFIARNTGALPIYIQGFDINGKHCEAYGFRILNCEGFELKPNDSKRVDIVFTPDFTLTRVERTLNIHTSQGPKGRTLKFMLVATIPRHMLSFCSQTLPRPSWELLVYYSFNTITSILLVGLLFFAHLDSRKLLRTSFFPFAVTGVNPEKIEKGNVFDLKSLSTANFEISGCLHVDNNKKAKERDLVDQKALASENSVPSSQKKNINIKNKDLLHIKEYEDSFFENNIRHSKKKAVRLRPSQETQSLESSLIEIKKSQPRNSWTRFLKPPFSFNSSLRAPNKPSVATQTSIEECESSEIKSLDLGTQLRSGNIMNIENIITNKPKLKTDIKNQLKKNTDSSHEEETSSTTTETSTTESDISEKDHHLPDVCVTSRLPNLRFLKNKTHDKNSGTNPLPARKTGKNSVHDGEGFELSSKSRGHKKIKVDPNKIFGGDILHPSTLELPYKPTPVNSEQKKGDLLTSDESLASYRNSSIKSKDDLFNDSHPSENFLLPQSLHRNFWPGDNVMDNSVSFSMQPNFSDNPITYSAVLSRDISMKTAVKTPCENSYMNNCKNTMSQHRNPNLHPSGNCSFASHFASLDDSYTSSTPLSFYCNRTYNDISGSKLKHWVGHSKSEAFIPMPDSTCTLQENSMHCPRLSNSSDLCDIYCANMDPVWSTEPITMLQALQAEHQHRIEIRKKQLAICTLSEDWPNFEMSSVENNVSDCNMTTVNSWDKDLNPHLTVESENVPDNIWNNGSLASCWENSSKVWTPPSRDNTVSPVAISNPNDSSKESATIDPNTSKTEINGEFDPFHTLSNLWIAQLNAKSEIVTTDTTSSNTALSFSLFSEPGVSNGTQIPNDTEENVQKSSMNELD